jgi:hypothetical protein
MVVGQNTAVDKNGGRPKQCRPKRWLTKTAVDQAWANVILESFLFASFLRKFIEKG